jgi:exopolysaccharide biosynthesis polyprenyl glycosylphosphotransferase
MISAIFRLKRDDNSDHHQPSYPGAPDGLPAPDACERPMLSDILKWLDRLTVVAVAGLTAWVGSHLLPQKQTLALGVADMVAVLVFCLALPRPRVPDLPLMKSIVRQVSAVALPLLLSGAAQVCVFWWLGWGEPSLLAATCVWALAVTMGFVTTRSLGAMVVNTKSVAEKLARKVAVIGDDRHAMDIMTQWGGASPKSVDIRGVFPPSAIDGLIGLSRSSGLDAIVIALPPDEEERIATLTWQLRGVLADVLIVPYLTRGAYIPLPVQWLGGIAFMVLQRRPLNEFQAVAKRMLDLVVALVACVMFIIPLFIVTAIAIKLDSRGPVFFRQPRRGLNNRPFTVYKFRSMYAGQADIGCATQTSRSDPRVTRVGKWLRRLSIDELPQILNVLRGEMSLVGPRPHALETRVEGTLLNDAIDDYVMRYQVKPGITGWAQINGSRGELVTTDDLRRRVSLDLEYIQRWSVFFDLKIMVLTVIREIRSQHAF